MALITLTMQACESVSHDKLVSEVESGTLLEIHLDDGRKLSLTKHLLDRQRYIKVCLLTRNDSGRFSQSKCQYFGTHETDTAIRCLLARRHHPESTTLYLTKPLNELLETLEAVS